MIDVGALTVGNNFEEVGHDFCRMCFELSHICNVLFLLTQWLDLGCVGVDCSLW